MAEEVLRGAKVDTEDGLDRMIEYLTKEGVLLGSDADRLKSLVHMLFSKKTFEDIAKEIERMADETQKAYKSATREASAVAVAITGIAKSSASWAREHKQAIHVVARDVEGAFAGAGAGAVLFPPAILYFTLAGAGAFSLDAYAQGAPLTGV